jgi:hypothetical protein
VQLSAPLPSAPSAPSLVALLSPIARHQARHTSNGSPHFRVCSPSKRPGPLSLSREIDESSTDLLVSCLRHCSGLLFTARGSVRDSLDATIGCCDVPTTKSFSQYRLLAERRPAASDTSPRSIRTRMLVPACCNSNHNLVLCQLRITTLDTLTRLRIHDTQGP